MKRIPCKIVSKCYVYTNDHKILILQRALNDTRPGARDLPGGNIEDITSIQHYTDDNIIQHELCREIHEETGLQIHQESIHLIKQYTTFDKKKLVIRQLYIGYTPDTHVQLSHEHIAYQRIDLIQIPRCDFGSQEHNSIYHTNIHIAKHILAYS